MTALGYVLRSISAKFQLNLKHPRAKHKLLDMDKYYNLFYTENKASIGDDAGQQKFW